MAEAKRYIKNMKTGVVFYWTEILAARNDMIETDLKGNALDKSEPKKPAEKPKEPAA